MKVVVEEHSEEEIVRRVVGEAKMHWFKEMGETWLPRNVKNNPVKIFTIGGVNCDFNLFQSLMIEIFVKILETKKSQDLYDFYEKKL